jgi:glutaminyl-tRNA synthetase
MFPKNIIEHAQVVDRVVTRFPPEPNGYLHIGHIKAIEASFGFIDYCKKHLDKDGECILRFDDTNPVTEKQEYINSIQENLNFLERTPSKVTYSSDYFDTLYDLAVKLIKQDNAYICELKSEDISLYRSEKKESPYKNRPVAESLDLFTRMKNGEFPDNSYTLRMKGDLTNPNACMWDLVFYRVLHKHHPRTGDKWCLYPSYDFTHCIVDSLEGITHSLCSKEFETRRESYYWLLDKLKLHKPLVYEFGRLNITDALLSKRKIIKLIEDKKVSGWDDPRLMTINGLRRRGFTASVLRNFASDNGLSKTESVLEYEKLEHFMRDELNETAPRRFAIKNPLKVIIENPGEQTAVLFDYPMYMKKILNKDTSVPPCKSTTRNMKITKTIYIDKNDFREVDEKKYYGLAPNKFIRLKYSEFIKCTGYEKESDGSIKEVYVKFDTPEKPKKVKGVMSWVNSDAKDVEIRMFDKLECKTYNGLIEPSFNMKENVSRVQFERVGYFYIDKDSFIENRLIFNSIVSLRSKYSKK